jgi:hyaluronoglucosaminidase
MMIGLIEGFFGPEWSWQNRHHICELISAKRGDFYIYAPKRDPYLRKSWMQDHPPEMWKELKKLSHKCQAEKIKFGIGLSPFEIHADWNEKSKRFLKEKIQKLEEIEFQSLGLFFDDMKGSPDLAERQCEIVEYTKSVTRKALLFCPTYYSDDPILDKVFGARPEKYLETLGENIAPDVQILWTGSKVIPASITAAELEVVAQVIQRKPFIWENYFANDGPKQCKFLKLKPFEGRSLEAFEKSAGWAINPMNQAHLSEVVFLASLNVLKKGMASREGYEQALVELAGPDTAHLINAYENAFLKVGLDAMDETTKHEARQKLKKENPVARDILDWLDGKYIVGSECLTD